jgi:V/A-type H+-transporting ATPase subunit E
MSNPDIPLSSGVEQLIQRLRDEGIKNGHEHAERVVQDAETRAAWILEQAKEEAERLRGEACAEAARCKQAGEEALKVAMRDAVLSLKAELEKRFAHEVQRLVGGETRKFKLLDQLVLAVAAQARDQVADAKQIDISLPRNVVGLEELRHNPETQDTDPLTECVRHIAQGIAREGVTFSISDDDDGGIRIHLAEQALTIDLTDKAVAELLLRHLQPRFRALLDGVVR